MNASTSRISRSALALAALSLAAPVLGCAEDSDPTGSVDPLQGAAGSALAGAGGAGGGGAGSAAAAGGTGAMAGGAGSAGEAGSAGATGGGAPDAGSEPATADAGRDGTFTLSSPAFDDNPGCGPDGDAPDACGLFEVDNTGLGDGADVSPPIEWTSPPAGTQSFAIAFHDLSNINGQSPFTHWVMWNIPGALTGLPAELPAGQQPGVPAANTQQVSFRPDDGFAGSGACGNVYEFVLYALSVPELEPPNTNSADAVQDALEASDDVLGTATMRGRSNPAGPCN